MYVSKHKQLKIHEYSWTTKKNINQCPIHWFILYNINYKLPRYYVIEQWTRYNDIGRHSFQLSTHLIFLELLFCQVYICIIIILHYYNYIHLLDTVWRHLLCNIIQYLNFKLTNSMPTSFFLYFMIILLLYIFLMWLKCRRK